MSDDQERAADQQGAPHAATPTPTPTPSPTRLRVDQTLLPPSDMPYGRMDLAFACALGPNVCLSFYQFDYQDAAAASISAGRNGVELEELYAKTILVSRISMDKEGFARLADEMKRMAVKAGIQWP